VTRDNVNQHGYACPTEAQAIYNADRKPDPPRKRSPSVMYEEDIKAMDKHRKAQSLAALMEEPAKAETDEYKQELKRARAMKATIAAMATIAGYECRVTLKDKSTGKVYEHDEL
jgi:hypothetical protein